jgi:hypothetical protein
MLRTPRRRRAARDIHALAVLLASWVTLAASGCGSESLWLNGPATAALGELTVFDVSADLPCGGKVFGGPSDPTGDLMVCHPFHKITQVVAAACDDDACVVESIDPPDTSGFVSVNVVGAVAGPTVFRVRAQLDDGSELSATASVAFAAPTGLHVSCNAALTDGYSLGAPYGQCGGLSPVFINSGWRWTLSFDSDAGLLPVFKPSVTVQGSAVAYDDTSGWFQSGAADGTAEVTIASRLYAEDVPVKVVSPADIVSGEARLVTFADGIEQPIADLGPAPTTLWYPTRSSERFEGDDGTVAILPRLILSDGTEAHGGAAFFASNHPEICTLYNLYDGAHLIQETFLDPICNSVGGVTFSATVGAASISWPVTVAPPPP